jgi:hypothetical protein
MLENRSEYRGYKIRARREGRGWRVAVSPKDAQLPILKHQSFRMDVPSVEEAIYSARVRIDLLLDVLR